MFDQHLRSARRTRICKMPSITNSSGTGDDDDFCDVVHVEQRGTPAQESIVVSTAHAAVEATSSSAATRRRATNKRNVWGGRVLLPYSSTV